MSKIKYDPNLSIEEISKNSGVQPSAVRKYIRERFIDREYESQLIKFRRVQQYFRDHEASNAEAAEALGPGYSRNTVKKYRNKENEPKPKRLLYNSNIDGSNSKAMVATVSDDDSRILNFILQEIQEDRFDCDLTFSKGDFYRNGIAYPRMCFDLYPNQPTDLLAAPEVYPLEEGYDIPDNSLASVVIDLPQSINENGQNGPDSFQSIRHLALSYYQMLKLAYRKLRYSSPFAPGGRLIVKVGDIMWNGKMIWMSKIVTELATGYLTDISSPVYDELTKDAEARGTDVEDEFPLFDLELVNKYVHTYDPESIPDNVAQGHAIKAHDFFLVFKKREEDSDTFYYGTDSNPEDKGQILSEWARTPLGPKLVARKSQAKGANIIEVKVPKKMPFNHLVYGHELQDVIKIRLLQELKSFDSSVLAIPRYACENGEKLLKYLKDVIYDKLTKEKRGLPSEVKHELVEILRKSGIKFIQEDPESTRHHPYESSRIIIDLDSVTF